MKKGTQGGKQACTSSILKSAGHLVLNSGTWTSMHHFFSPVGECFRHLLSYIWCPVPLSGIIQKFNSQIFQTFICFASGVWRTIVDLCLFSLLYIFGWEAFITGFVFQRIYSHFRTTNVPHLCPVISHFVFQDNHPAVVPSGRQLSQTGKFVDECCCYIIYLVIFWVCCILQNLFS